MTKIFEDLRKLHKEAQHSYLTYTSIIMSQVTDFANNPETYILCRQMLYKWPDVVDAYLDVLADVAEKHYDIALEVVRKDLFTIIETPFLFIWNTALSRIKILIQEPDFSHKLKEAEVIQKTVETSLEECNHAVDRKNILIDGINKLYESMTAKLGIQYPKLQRLKP